MSARASDRQLSTHFQYITTVANEAPQTIGIGYCDVGETFSASRALCAGASGFSIAGPASRVLGIGWDGHVCIPGGHRVFVWINLTVATLGASGTAGLSGILVPRGNIVTA